jgi:uncharacterized protein YbjT (DUF2867 family)
MRIAVAGGTGMVGRHTVSALTEFGHDPVTLARSAGVDLTSGDGLADALAGTDAIIDVTNTDALDPAAAIEFFGTVSRNLLDAAGKVGVRHHVALSIVGIDRVTGTGHYAGKRRQEEVVETGSIPWSIVRATQFYEFAEMVVGWTRSGDRAIIAPLLVQPAAAVDVARTLVEVATGAPQGRIEVAGPQTQDLVDMARRVFAARGDLLTLVPTWRRGVFDAEMAGEVLLPGADARITPTTFEQWLASGGSGSAR